MLARLSTDKSGPKDQTLKPGTLPYSTSLTTGIQIIAKVGFRSPWISMALSSTTSLDTAEKVNNIRQILKFALYEQNASKLQPQGVNQLKGADKEHHVNQPRSNFLQQVLQQHKTINLQFELAGLLGCSPNTKDLSEASFLFRGLIEANYRR